MDDDVRFNFKDMDNYESKETLISNDVIKKNECEDVVGIGTWIILSIVPGLLGFVPIVGPIIILITLIFMSFTDINLNLKNWARANLIIVSIVFIFLLITMIL